MEKGYKKGFTLSEVLITLMVIGVVAAMTIPAFIANHQKTVYVTSLKKIYATVNQALQKAAIEHCGTSDISCLFPPNDDMWNLSDDLINEIDSNYGSDYSEYLIKNFLVSEFNVAKYCGDSIENCGSITKQNYDGSGITQDWFFSNGYYTFATADGAVMSIDSYGNSCRSNFGSGVNSPPAKSCGLLNVDVNGKKGPNIMGRDVFQFIITSNKMPLLYPHGGKVFDDDGNGNEATGGDGWWNYSGADKCGTNIDKDGNFCAGRIIEEGWEMKY